MDLKDYSGGAGAAWVKVEAECKPGYVHRDYITTTGE
jgi:hypothetical protein